MRNINSFDIDHTKLLPGLYVSRKDYVGNEVITTFDLRVCRPNVEPVMETGELHAIEHLVATYLRNDSVWSDKTVYFGPMGCRTGFYLILSGDYESQSIIELVKDCFKFVSTYEGDIPGATEKGCGNYRDMDLELARHTARVYANTLEDISESQLVYPNAGV